MRFFSFRTIAAVCLLGAVGVAPVSAAAGHAGGTKCSTTKSTTHHTVRTASAAPAINLGATGGNMVPWSVTIASDGTISGNGWNKPKNGQLSDPKNTLAALYKLADTENFWGMKGFTNCSGTLPDIASLYLEINSNTGTKRVQVHGGCVTNFNQLLAVYENAVGLTR